MNYGDAWDKQIEIRGSPKEVAIGDNLEDSFNYEIDLMKEYLAEPILDAGTGYGRLLKHFNNIIGVDDSILMVKEASNLNPTKSIFKASITDLNIFPSSHFNSIICDRVLLHLPNKDFEKSLSEFYRILKTNGRIFVTVPTIWNWKNFVFNLRVKLHLFRRYENSIGARVYTLAKIRKLIEKNGFELIRFEIFNNFTIIAIAEVIK